MSAECDSSSCSSADEAAKGVKLAAKPIDEARREIRKHRKHDAVHVSRPAEGVEDPSTRKDAEIVVETQGSASLQSSADALVLVKPLKSKASYVTQGALYVERSGSGAVWGRRLDDSDMLPPYDPATTIRIVCISDTHGHHQGLRLPYGDILIHSGDMFRSTRRIEDKAEALALVQELNTWFGQWPHKHKFCIAGNHDKILEDFGADKTKGCFTNITYLEHEAVSIDELGLKIYAAPISSGRSSNRAFQPPRGDDSLHVHRLPSQPVGDALQFDIMITHEAGVHPDLVKYLAGHRLQDRRYPPCRVHIGGHIHRNGVRKVEARHLDPLDAPLTIVPCSVKRHGCLDPDSPPVVLDYPRNHTTPQSPPRRSRTGTTKHH